MAIPEPIKMRIPLLRLLEKHSSLTLEIAEEALARELQITKADRAQKSKSRQSLFSIRFRYALSCLYRSGLADRPETGVYKINHLGRNKLRLPEKDIHLFIHDKLDLRMRVEHAFDRYRKGERPRHYNESSIDEYILYEEDKCNYPVNAIWGLATDQNSTAFHTHHATGELTELHYNIVKTKNNLSISKDDFDKAVEKSRNNDDANRKKRLNSAPKKPGKHYTQVIAFRRNPDVVAEVLKRASGKCEKCKKDAPFMTRKKRPYLEIHHKIQLANNGDDTVKNAIALCPNCHREAHYG